MCTQDDGVHMRSNNFVPAEERRHPYQVYTAALLVVGGMPVLIGGSRPGSINQYLPSLLVYVWAGVIVLGGATLVAAAVVRSPLTALYLERVAHAPIAVMCVVYSGSVAALAGWNGAFACGVVAGVAVAAVLRARKVSRTLRELRRTLRGAEERP